MDSTHVFCKCLVSVTVTCSAAQSETLYIVRMNRTVLSHPGTVITECIRASLRTGRTDPFLYRQLSFARGDSALRSCQRFVRPWIVDRGNISWLRLRIAPSGTRMLDPFGV